MLKILQFSYSFFGNKIESNFMDCYFEEKIQWMIVCFFKGLRCIIFEVAEAV